jgi:outer membrane protein TolC
LPAIFIGAAETEAIEPAESFVIRNVEYQSLDNAAKFQIQTNEPIDYAIYELEDPYRIVIDPLDAIWCDFEQAVHFKEGLVRSIKFVKGRELPEGPGSPYYSFDFVTIELQRPFPYEFDEDEHIFTLNIGEEREAARPKPENFDEARMIEEELMEEFAREEKAELTKEREEINIAKDELDKQKSLIEKEKMALAKEKDLLEKNKEDVKKKRDIKDMFKSRPVRDFSKETALDEYSGKTLALDDCIQIAVSNSLSIKVTKEKIKLAKMKVNESFRELFPEFSLMWDETRGTITDAHYRGRKFGLEFKQPVSHGGEIITLWEQSKINLKVAKENLNKEKEASIFDVTKSYYGLAKVINKYNFQKMLLDDARIDFEMAEKEFDLDLMTEIDFLRLKASLHNIRQVLFAHQNNIALAALELKKVMNVDMTSDIKIDSTLEEKDIQIDRDECVALAMQFKPEYRISYFNTEVSKLSERLAQAKTFPQIDIFGKYLKSAERLEPLNVEPLRHFLDNERILGATVSLPWGPHTVDYQKKRTKLAPTVTTFESDTRSITDKLRINLFDNMGRYTDIKDATIKYKEALEVFNKAEQDIYTDIDEAFFSFEESKLKIESALINIELHKRELEVQKLRKDYNEASYEDLVEARNKLLAAMGIYKEALGDYYIAIARINKAIGLGGYFE